MMTIPSVCAEPFGVSASSAILYEPELGRVLYEKDIHTPRPMASTTKIMTALLGLERCAPETEITVPDAAVRVEGTALGLRGGDKITMRDLITGLLLVSGNDAANTVAYAVSGGIPAFAEEMNRRAAEIGMKDTTFVTPSGLDEGEHSSSAYDMALLAAEAMKNELFADICARQSAVVSFGNPMREISIRNHNRLLSLYDGAVGIKTGFTKKSGRCL
ncbi:MAG: D-alanyl-D-alanine carboxypeptidase, partial [Clostridiales bacterium]|nr:D-alanyl-D-alanine carboxypeptidase [Clostridiales bacterium]